MFKQVKRTYQVIPDSWYHGCSLRRNSVSVATVSMKNKKTKLFNQLALGVILSASPSIFAANITVFDGRSSPSAGPSYWGVPATGQGAEDQETEGGTSAGQNWDLEAFGLSGNKLSIIGGFPLLTANPGETDFKLGDIFFDTNGNYLGADHAYKNPVSNILHNNAGEIIPQTPTPGAAFGDVNNSDFGYEYVIHFTRNSASADPTEAINGFQVIKIDNNSILTSIGYQHGQYDGWGFDGDHSNPYQYASGGTVDTSATGALGGKLSFVDGLDDASLLASFGITATGGSHDVLTLDLPSYLFANGANLHETLGCGNDNMAGLVPNNTRQRNVPDGGTTAMLLSFGFASLAFVKRKA